MPSSFKHAHVPHDHMHKIGGRREEGGGKVTFVYIHLLQWYNICISNNCIFAMYMCTCGVVLQALLLIGLWMEDTAHFDTQTVLKQYKVGGGGDS